MSIRESVRNGCRRVENVGERGDVEQKNTLSKSTGCFGTDVCLNPVLLHVQEGQERKFLVAATTTMTTDVSGVSATSGTAATATGFDATTVVAATTGEATTQTTEQTAKAITTATGVAAGFAAGRLAAAGLLARNLMADGLADVLGAGDFLLARNTFPHLTIVGVRNTLGHVAGVGFGLGAGLTDIAGHLALDLTRHTLVGGAGHALGSLNANALAAGHRVANGFPAGLAAVDHTGGRARGATRAARILGAVILNSVAQGLQRSVDTGLVLVEAKNSLRLHHGVPLGHPVASHDRFGVGHGNAIIDGLADRLGDRLANHVGHGAGLGDRLTNALVTGARNGLANSLVGCDHFLESDRNTNVAGDSTHGRCTAISGGSCITAATGNDSTVVGAGRDGGDSDEANHEKQTDESGVHAFSLRVKNS